VAAAFAELDVSLSRSLPQVAARVFESSVCMLLCDFHVENVLKSQHVKVLTDVCTHHIICYVACFMKARGVPAAAAGIFTASSSILQCIETPHNLCELHVLSGSLK
jgi:hypothetical protein